MPSAPIEAISHCFQFQNQLMKIAVQEDSESLLSQLPEHWDYMHAPAYLETMGSEYLRSRFSNMFTKYFSNWDLPSIQIIFLTLSYKDNKTY